jgi:hypothetical protein
MVEKKFMHTVLKSLEKYLVKKNNFQLIGETYDLILFIPSDRFQSHNKFSLLISYNRLNNLNQKDVIKDLLNYFKEDLGFEEYNSISRLNILHSEDSFVKNLKLVFAFKEQIFELKDIPIGGVQIDFAYLVKSLVLDKLISNSALKLEVVTENSMSQIINAGIIRIEQNFDVVYYTSKGLREIWKADMTETEKENAEYLKTQSENFLIENKFISKTNLDRIVNAM